ncbi:MAG: phospholipid carrier-dependent glycosyltransferase, partial [Lentisphaeria bacterium]|nr:phospholipid carrier-dependent glycosyltransferase [Lentisphaeria bacterium]
MDKRESFIKSFSGAFKENKLLFLIFFLLLAYSLFLRLFPLNIRTLEYDEIYTVINFVPLSFPKIFTDVATPNNHMLHTFFVKLFYAPNTDFFQLSIRLCCALAGTFTLLLFLPFRKYFQTLYGILFAILLFAFNGAHIHYSQTARGYSLLTFFLLLTIFSLWKYEKKRKENAPAKSLIFYAALYFLSACAASVSVSSGVIFAFAVTFSFLL